VALDGRQAQDSTAAEAKDNGPAHVGADVEGSGGVVETKGQQDTIDMMEEDDVDDDDPQVCGSFDAQMMTTDLFRLSAWT
jgi:hypothetical protein